MWENMDQKNSAYEHLLHSADNWEFDDSNFSEWKYNFWQEIEILLKWPRGIYKFPPHYY